MQQLDELCLFLIFDFVMKDCVNSHNLQMTCKYYKQIVLEVLTARFHKYLKRNNVWFVVRTSQGLIDVFCKAKPDTPLKSLIRNELYDIRIFANCDVQYDRL